MDLFYPLLAIASLIFINGLFVAAEFAIIGVRRSRLEQLTAEGHSTARQVYTVLSDPKRVDSYIATAQLGITLASLGLGMYAEPVIAHLIEGPLESWFGLEGAITHSIAFILALATITYLHIVFGEMVPKSLSLQDSERMALALNGPMHLAGVLFVLPVRILNGVGRLLLRLFNIHPSSLARGYNAEELELIVSESRAGGLLEDYEQNLVANIFDFSKRRVVEVMTPRTRIQAIPIDTPEAEVLRLLEEASHNRLPVYEDTIDNIIGMLHIKDLIRQRLSGQPYNLRALLRSVPFVPESLLAENMLGIFRRQHYQMALVIDEYGGILGLVTLEDLIEEIFGEVQDEFDPDEEPPLVEEAPGKLLARGDVILEDIEAYIDLGDHDQKVHTIGGLVMAKLGHVSTAGEEVMIGSARVRVEEISGNSIRRVSVQYAPKTG